MLCVRCGSEIKPDDVVVIRDHEVGRTTELLRGEWDFVRCAAGCHTDIPAAICYWAAEEHEAIFSPAVFKLGDRSALRALDEQLALHDDRTYAGTSTEDFRTLIKSLLYRRIVAVRPILSALRNEEFERRWRRLRAAVFAAIGVAAEGLIPGIRIGKGPGLQARVWAELCHSWHARNSGLPATFEGDLRRYVDGWAFPATLKKFSQLIAEVGRAELGLAAEFQPLAELMTWAALDGTTVSDDVAVLYYGRAVEASAYAQAGLPNPAAQDWATAYVMLELLTESEPGSSFNQRLRISPERACATLSPEALGEVAQAAVWAGSLHRREWSLERISAVLARAGHGGLAVDLGRQWAILAPADQTAVFLAKHIDGLDPEDAAGIVARRGLWWPVVYAGGRADFDRVAASLARKLGPAAVLTLGEMLIAGRLPYACLDYLQTVEGIGTSDDPPLRAEFSLRARALVLAGQAEQALAEIEARVEWFSFPLDPVAHKYELVTAVALRESGRVDRAITVLENLWTRGLRDSLLPYVAVELGPAYFAVGRFHDAVTVLRKGLEHAREAATFPIPLLKAQFQYALIRAGLAAEEDLWKINLNVWPLANGVHEPPPSDRLADLYIALAHLEELRREPAANRRDSLLARLPGLAAEAAERGDCFVHLQAERACALDRELRGEHPGWETLRTLAERYSAAPPIECAVRPAAVAIAAGDHDAALIWLCEADRLVTRAIAKLEDFEQAAAVETVRVDDLGALLDTAAPAELLRIVEELRRDPARRILGREVFADDRAVSAFADRAALTRTAVLESWGGWLLMTIIEQDSQPVSDLLLPTNGLRPLAATLGARFANWTLDRPGDPLDVPRWQEFTDRLCTELRARLHPDDQIVVIDAGDLHQLPWHLTLGPSWVFAYAPSWGSMLLQPPPTVDRPRVAALSVPRFGESSAVAEVLRGSLAASVTDAERAGLTHTHTEGPHADAAALVQILENSDLCTLLCHGLVDADASSVSLLLAADGCLPLGNSIAAARSGRPHRFDWQQAARIERAPRTIFSAACSSGLNHVRGGQQVGLFSALRHRGLRTLIAPRWDIMAEQALPVLNRSRSLIIHGRRPGEALRTACLEAEQAGTPSWIAWSLALEGDWW